MLILALALAATPAAAQAPLPLCRQARPMPVREQAEGRARKLGELPPAEAYLTVMRTENGCIKPVLVREERNRRP
ncbi:hypothetical protein HJG53_04465 [Sphingomonas sp. ID1715]|uniref:hypothetical protein n=1 Tax=Sphingomonas sp. ID1715 TaxID=1656898 RepID=UPI001488C1A4|nr:hypothetical protein [Sphingomonas sp. ID1715]NNM76159.1 hypothetical protein [Sphingomonas sp. ID1715]